MTRETLAPEVPQTMDRIHPDVRRALEAMELPEVNEMLQRLGKYGLGIGIPHMHGEEGEFLPLPNDKVAVEEDLKVSFRSVDESAVQTAIPVMWRWIEGDGEVKAVGKCVNTVCIGKCHYWK